MVWARWVFSLPVAGGTAIWPMLFLILGLNRVVAGMLRLIRIGERDILSK